jgi:soluble lytic murein transglycosylase
LLASLCLFTASAIASPRIDAAQSSAGTLLDARDALRKKDRDRLAALRTQASAEANALAMWVDYWELTNRIGEAQQPELTAFAGRWSGTYVEDRLRNDWLLELGRRRDWVDFAAEFPRFRMNDDREVTCYSLMADQVSGKDVKEAGVAAWLAQKDADDGCALLASTLFDAKQIGAADVWKKVRLSMEAGRPRAARQAAALLGPKVDARVGGVANRSRVDDAGADAPGDDRQRLGRLPSQPALGTRVAARPCRMDMGERGQADGTEAAA